jgi:D-hexose-6-phosphate mutarotase
LSKAPWVIGGSPSDGSVRRGRRADPDLQSRRRRCRLAVLAGAVSRDLHRDLRADPVVATRRAKPRDAFDIFEEALHTYFAISDISTIAISGLAGTTYIDKTDAARRKPQTAALVTITAETDRVYLDTPGRCAIEDRGWHRRVVIEKLGAASSVVWNPWAEKAAAMVDLGDPAWRGMVCVETGNIADNEVRVAADGEHQMSTAISVDAGP